jgi:glycolate oxidase iron-sulfur subunit
MSRRLLESKMAEVEGVAPQIIVTANPGCMIQLDAGVHRSGLEAEVLHVVDLLDRAYRAGERPSPPAPLP